MSELIKKKLRDRFEMIKELLFMQKADGKRIQQVDEILDLLEKDVDFDKIKAELKEKWRALAKGMIDDGQAYNPKILFDN